MTGSDAPLATFPGFGAVPAHAQHCLAVLVHGGEFRSADFLFPISDGGLTLSGGIADGQFVAPDDDSHGLYSKPLIVPGGVTGYHGLSRVMRSMGNVTATVQAVNPMTIHDLLAFELTLYLRIHVHSPFVGGDCYIGTPDEPLTVRLHRLDWDQYVPALSREGVPDHVIAITNLHVGGSKFTVPAVSGAGPKGAFNTFVNSRAGLPNRGKTTSLKIQASAFLAQNPDYEAEG